MTAVVKTFEWALCSCYVVQPLRHFPCLQGVNGAEGHALQESRQSQTRLQANHISVSVSVCGLSRWQVGKVELHEFPPIHTTTGSPTRL